MKNIFRFLMAAAVMFGAVACSQSDEIQEVVGGEEVVSVLSLELEDLGTRLAGDAGKIDKVAWGIYDEAGNFLAPHSSEVKGVADFKGGKAEIEVSGNVTKENIARLVDLGVDFISSGALTHSAPILDISLKNLHAI